MRTTRSLTALAPVGAVIWAALALPACTQPADAQNQTAAPAARTAEGQPYQLKGTQVWTVPDPASGRDYQVFVSLPASYDADPDRRYPVLYVTDADYAFPLIRSITRRINLDGPVTEDFILVGLSYAVGDDGGHSRRRDYTPTRNGSSGAPPGTIHGQGPAYQTYLRDQVLPFIASRFRADPARRVFMGHSYGGLLGAQIMFTEPTLFHDYILGSPSLWFDKRHMMAVEAQYAEAHRDLPANVFMYIGEFEAVRPGDARYASRTDMVADMRTFEHRLKSRNYPDLSVASDVVVEENHLTVFPSGFTRGLIAVLPAR